jgi:hypothetical protein
MSIITIDNVAPPANTNPTIVIANGRFSIDPGGPQVAHPAVVCTIIRGGSLGTDITQPAQPPVQIGNTNVYSWNITIQNVNPPVSDGHLTLVAVLLDDGKNVLDSTSTNIYFG